MENGCWIGFMEMKWADCDDRRYGPFDVGLQQSAHWLNGSNVEGTGGSSCHQVVSHSENPVKTNKKVNLRGQYKMMAPTDLEMDS
ncbi:unnamed protein product [Bursaphelenchus xylophilus]|uniref:(pine wood nematode) hypothetical protein n=1 Tax=Bursaphelenchus xylophilus TaxID=6326 RepID=A0A7I8XQ41_BURXY|nr:unnamed protein product [Bursaphelenchus xylophilus]CAG9088043.1 unnamed protein product [Bursaphelenchus xylophilus]